ncbi:DUF2069 domain-containing protein [Thermomonas haemolytica]|uniref:Putative membrane protein DUF2069 n=1 Tax=Thermomonas haemolytica TaxID=141949 RepID=A0A4R3N328_9GAMM|nr:DUF2069 domain-containing protein [Thermomonas haemolytica]TCT23530.1 putative membrane protein DUF2069 [Thermomonas haemolytica]TNY30402.1 hypothetical protein BV505_00090 [Thermomonas haemolytica]
MSAQPYLAGVLLALALLFAGWAFVHPHPLAGLLVFALPPALLAMAALRGWRRAGFTAGVLALLWFSHGVMLLWAEPAARAWALGETLLALLIVHAACLPGWRARRQARHAATRP